MLFSKAPKEDVVEKHLGFTFRGRMPIILVIRSSSKLKVCIININLAIFHFIKGFFDFLRVNDSKRLITSNYSHHKAKVNNKAPETKHAKNNTEEDEIKDKKMEDAGRDKMEHEKLVGNTKMNTAEITMTNINIVIYSLPHYFFRVCDPSLSVVCNALKYTL